MNIYKETILNKLDLSEIDQYLLSKGSTINEVEKRKDAYVDFLSKILMEKEGKLSPTPDADIFWHAHILHTEKYAKDCNKVFGRFVHHRPKGKQCDSH